MISQIENDLKEVYKHKPNRLNHVYGVRDMAISLGKRYNCDIEKLEIAALLHDITKYYTKEENIDIIRKNYTNSEDIIKEYNEHILHAFSARVIAIQKYHISDQDILNSIMHHTIGKANMSIYEKIIFISDYTEMNRTYESCVKTREILEENIDLAVYTAINDSITFYEKTGGEIPASAYTARTFYKQLLEEKHDKN